MPTQKTPPATLAALVAIVLSAGLCAGLSGGAPLHAQPAPSGPALAPGLAGAALRPGWVTPQGTRMTAVELLLEPGWKTYWRAPGDAGIPPQFDWTGSQNLGPVTFHWPAPEVIDSGGIRTLGFHDQLLLPVEVTPAKAGQPVSLTVAIDFGLCREICVPAHVTLTAPPAADQPDPQIKAALQRVPQTKGQIASCRIAPIADGLRVEARVPQSAEATLPIAPLPDAAMEVMTPPGASQVWVSEADVARADGQLTVAADLVGASAKPFDLNAATVRLTLLGPDGAVQYDGCAPG